MKLYTPLRLIPPIILPLIVYIITTSLFWGVWDNAISGYLALFCGISFFLILVALLYLQANRYFLVFIATAALLALVRNHQIISHFNAFPFEETTKGITIEATLDSYSFQPASRFPFCHTLSLKKIKKDGHTYPLSYVIQIYTRQRLAAQIGDTIKIPIIFLKKPNNDSFYLYLMKEGVVATAFQESVPLSIVSHSPFYPSRWFFETRESLLYAFQKSLNKRTFELFAAIFLGEKGLIKKNKESREEPFKKWGIVHYLARSGLHLVILVSLCEFILKCIPVGFMLKQLMLLITVLMYFFLTWSSISFIRALLIFLMYKYCTLSRTPNHFLHFLLLCCFILLLINPLYIFFLDFQLSFGLTFALAWLNQFRTASPRKIT